MRLSDLWPFQRSPIDPRLVGCWHRIGVDGPEDQARVVELDLRADGTMLHSMFFGEGWRVVELAFHIDGPVLVLRHRASKTDNRMGFVLEQDDVLRLDAQDGCTWYERGPKKAPDGGPTAQCFTADQPI